MKNFQETNHLEASYNPLLESINNAKAEKTDTKFSRNTNKSIKIVP